VTSVGEAEASGERDGSSGFTFEQLERAILGDAPRLTRTEVAAAAEVDPRQVRRLWRALGFPEPDDRAELSHTDLEALSTLAAAVESSVLDFDTAVRLTRAVGQTIARLAEWQVSTLTERVEELERGSAATGSRLGSALLIADAVGVPFEKLLVYSWRRHLAAAVGRVEAMAAKDEDPHTVEVTVGFADLVGFSALANEIDDDRLADLVERFESRCADVVAGRAGRVIKTLGDSVLFLSQDPVEAMEIALGVVNVIGHDGRLPDVRLGLATGPVILRLGDVFGAPVNLAARLTSVARRNRVLVDAKTADRLPEERFRTRTLPGRPMRGFGVVEPVAVGRR
jgi:adenylate cyclase